MCNNTIARQIHQHKRLLSLHEAVSLKPGGSRSDTFVSHRFIPTDGFSQLMIQLTSSSSVFGHCMFVKCSHKRGFPSVNIKVLLSYQIGPLLLFLSFITSIPLQGELSVVRANLHSQIQIRLQSKSRKLPLHTFRYARAKPSGEH